MAPFVLILFVLMILLGGIAVDVMRFETRRVAVQNTLDRATLAAASLTQAGDPENVVIDYFAKADLGAELSGVNVEEGLNYRIVTASAVAATRNFFMSMTDIPSLQAMNNSQAEQRINDVEVMLILDISGSMKGDKITNLKAAAHNFVETVTEHDPDHRISIGIIPYNAQVNIGASLRGKFNATHLHGVENANCLELPSNTFGTLALSRAQDFPMMAVADTVTDQSSDSGYVALTNSRAKPGNSAASRWCNPNTKTEITLPTKSKTALHEAIDALEAEGNTSILLGMRWGTALLDPSFQPVYGELIGAGAMAADMADRPYAYDEPDAMKVIVLMTDGEHVAHTRVPDAYKSGASPIYRSSGDGMLSIYHAGQGGANKYWVPHKGTWQKTAWNSGSGVEQQSWQQVWARVTVSWVAKQLYSRALGTSFQQEKNKFLVTYQSVNSMDSLLASNCAAARASGTLIYGIAFQAPTKGVTAIRDCASRPASNYFFDVQGLDIDSAFSLIASNLSQLRLTQ